jgi:UDP-4-amino-4-deoxy-L-arabinose formyltransferase/UDP-glucuronic acid dehydrogenase (UDP-4-keto-hexauronic acid decarboxylating)
VRAVVFAYHNMGVIGIRNLLAAGYTIPLVFSHEDDANENVWFESVPEFCKERRIPCVCPRNPNQFGWIGKIKAEEPDIIFSFYYRYMLKPDILSIPPLGAYNLHGSYLPAYRGRCPVNWVILKGERETGVTLHEMVEKPDAGAIVARKKVDISHEDTAHTLFKKLELAADAMLKEILPVIKSGDIPKTPMDLSRGSYYGGRKPEDGRIFWDRPAEEIYNLIRAVTRPYPGAFGFLGDTMVLFWRAVPVDEPSPEPGMITADGENVLIGTGNGCLRPLEIEVNSRVLSSGDMLTYFREHKGEKLA